MSEFRIHVDLGGFAGAGLQQFIARQAFPLINQAVRAIASQTAENWRTAVNGASLWSKEKNDYIDSIRWEMTGELSALVFTDYKLADEIEKGRPARDLKRMLDTSPKVRRTQAGKRFLIIPMRHNTPGASNGMPQHVYDQASQLAPSRILAQTTRRAGEITSAAFGHGMVPLSEKRQRRNPYLKSTSTRQDVRVTKNIYGWGGRMVAGSMGPNPRGKSDRFAGMYRFDTSTPGGGRSSEYLTFRVMMEGSPGWVVAPRPGLNIARDVATNMQPLAEKAIAEAIARGLA